METHRGWGEDYDRQQDRKVRRREAKLAQKRARVEAHQRWVEQRRELKYNKIENNKNIKQQQHNNNNNNKREEKKRVQKTQQKGRLSTVEDSINLKKSSVQGKENNKEGAIMTSKQEKKSKLKRIKFENDETIINVEESNKKDSVLIEPKSNNTESNTLKYIPPSLRRKITSETNTALDEVTRRVINKLTVRNVADMTREISELFTGGIIKGATRASVLKSLSQHINRMCMLDAGPLTPIVSLPFAGLIRGLQLLHGNVVGAELIESLCIALYEHIENNNETGATNGAMVIGHLYILNAIDSQLIASFLRTLLQIGSKGSLCAIACGLTLLRACGEKLLKEAPVQMEQALHEAKSYHKKFQQNNNNNNKEIQDSDNSRYKALLSFITDIVTGHTRSAKRMAIEEELPVDSILSDMSSLLPGGNISNNKRALLRVMGTTSVLIGITWAKIIRSDKPPRWFMPGAWDNNDNDDNDNNNKHEKSLNKNEINDTSSTENNSESETDEEEDENEMKLERIRRIRQHEKAISGQRLNTENKREVFHCIANASDDLEAFTLLMHRDPSFSRLHDTLTVLLQCCYQEKVYNPFYAQVIQRFCSAKNSCRNTLQFAIWDLFKAIRIEQVDVIGYFNLSCLLTYLLQEGTFTLSVLRGLDLDNTNRTIGLFTRILLLRLILQLPAGKLTEIFFGGDGFKAHDVKIDMTILRGNLAKFMERYFIDVKESEKWLPHFYDVVAAGTEFDIRMKLNNNNNINNNNSNNNNNNKRNEIDEEEVQLQSFMKRIQVAFKALKSGIS